MIRYADVKPGMVPRWEHTYPGRFEHEIRDLLHFVGDSLRVDGDLLAKGILRLTFTWPLPDDRKCALQAVFPDTYPFIRPQVSLVATQDSFPERHVSPIDGTLCLLGRDSGLWPAKWTLAELLNRQLANALGGSGSEDPQGEPMEVWWNSVAPAAEGYVEGSYMLVDSSWDLGSALIGTAKISFALERTQGGIIWRGAVDEVKAADGTVLAKREFTLPSDIEARKTSRTFPWRRVERLAPPTQAMSRDRAFWDDVVFNKDNSGPALDGAVSMSITVQSTEIAHERRGDTWLFAALYGPAQSFRRPKPGQKPHKQSLLIVPTYRAGIEDVGGRVPSVDVLRNKTVTIFGLGAIGAPLVIELARNGCRKIIVLDHDFVEPGNSIRWPLGSSAWGRRKVSVLKEFVEREYPATMVQAVTHHVGAAAVQEGTGDLDVLPGIIAEADLVVDATASSGVSRLLADLCQRAAKMMVSAYATASLKGGVVAVYHPASGCPTCREFAYQSGHIQKPPGSGESEALRQPPGCAELTFTGASFDLQELSLAAVRTVVDVMTNPSSYQGSMINTLSLHDGTRSAPPSWTADLLPPMRECGCKP